MVDFSGRWEGGLLALRRRTASIGTDWGRWLLTFSLPDWILVAYLVPIGLAVGMRSPRRWADPLAMLPLFSILFYMAWARAYHVRWNRNDRIRTLYHISGIPALALTYFQLRTIIPVVNPVEADAVLAAADLRLFPVHPSIWFESFSSYFTVEWFSFFYQLYIYLGGAFLVTMVLFDRNRNRQGLFAVGILLLMLGHHFYLFVPARGPWRFLEPLYAGDLPGGPIFHHVMATQIHAGPGLDAFPSLHTAITMFLTLFVRQHWPRFRWLGYFLASQIIFATMFLRFHYVVDVIAGFAFGLLVFSTTPNLLAWYQRRRAAAGLDAADPW